MPLNSKGDVIGLPREVYKSGDLFGKGKAGFLRGGNKNETRKKINCWLVGGIVMGAFLLSGALLSAVEGITFLKVKFMRVQEELGRQIKESGQLQQRGGEIQERLGALIRDAGPHGKIDQESVGKGIAEAAHLKWQEGATQERLGLAI